MGSAERVCTNTGWLTVESPPFLSRLVGSFKIDFRGRFLKAAANATALPAFGVLHI